jgi:wobble nucleotide-excising tRNase
LNKRGQKFVYHITIDNHEVRTDKESKSLSRTLSEGEKNALAFAFFLASLDLKANIENKLIVFDDPITSMDYKRRSVTISILSKYARLSSQFILLSHDINFIKDFTQRNSDVLNLKIINAEKTNVFVPQDIEDETLTGVFKDLKVLNDFVQKGESSEYSMRDVVRCIRPVLEGFFRIKFYKYIKKTDWLADMINYIRNSNEGDSFYREKENLDALCDINDYSKVYHHSNPNYLEVPLNATELQLYCKRTINLLEKL